jgi:squalene-hopene/tetraprenyl-beta-curcumene cyclase
LDWQAAVQFVQRIQNLPEYNEQPWVSDSPQNLGGFAYHPDNTRAGTYVDDEGVVRFNSFGSMTYAGMLSFIYAEVDRNDPRVQSAADWAIRHWTLEENPGTGLEGLYYYYNVLTKGLAAFGQNQFIREDGDTLNWREEVAEKVVAVQRMENATGKGYWVNDVGRYWENDPVLVTAYSILALQMALGM